MWPKECSTEGGAMHLPSSAEAAGPGSAGDVWSTSVTGTGVSSVTSLKAAMSNPGTERSLLDCFNLGSVSSSSGTLSLINSMTHDLMLSRSRFASSLDWPVSLIAG